MFTLACIAGYMLIVGGMLWGNHRWRLAQTPTPPPPDPDDTADDYDDDTVRITQLPPVPLPAAWDDFDEVMFRWFAEGAR